MFQLHPSVVLWFVYNLLIFYSVRVNLELLVNQAFKVHLGILEEKEEKDVEVLVESL